MTPVFGKNVVYDAPPKIRRQQMQFLSNGLKSTSLRRHVGSVVEECEKFFAQERFHPAGGSGTMDLREVLSELIIVTSSRALMGKLVREQLHNQVASLYHDLDAGITPLSFFAPNLPCPGHWKRNKARKAMTELFSRVIDKRREEMKAREEEAKKNGEDLEEGEDDDILGRLIKAKYKDGSDCTHDQICGLLIALLFAGQHTSSITATWATLLLLQQEKDHKASHGKSKGSKNGASVLDRIMQEQSTVPNLDYDGLSELQLLHCTVKETLRHYPPLILLMRKVMKDIEVTTPMPAAQGGQGEAKAPAKFTVPKGDIVLTAPAFGRFDSECFEENLKFDPDRYINPDDDTLKKELPFSFVGFGGGMHACMGQQFAYMQLKAVLSVLLNTFDLEMVAKELPEPDYEAMVVGPKGGCEVRFKRKGAAVTGTKVTKASQAEAKAKASNRTEKELAATVAPAGANTKYFTKAEVAKHNTRSDAWTIVQGRVYDITEFVSGEPMEHPGGEIILESLGCDSTDGFLGEQHPPTVRDVLEEYYIGDLK